eukprot:240442-Rhodomonas_salina.1
MMGLVVSNLLYCLHLASATPGPAAWFPIAIAILFLAWSHASGHAEAMAQSAAGVAFAASFRVCVVIATFAHEWAHVIAALFFGQASALDSGNWSCNVPLRAWVWSVIPFVPWHQSASMPHIHIHPSSDKTHATAIRSAGAAFSLALAAGSSILAARAADLSSPLLHGAMFGVWSVAAGSFVSDVLRIEAGEQN